MSVKINKGSALDMLNLTPLIDMVFLLLIFFLVASEFSEEERALLVNLPDASEAQPLILSPKDTVVSIRADGSYFVNGATVSGSRLDELLTQVAADNPGSTVNVRSDEEAPSKHLFFVLNTCKKHRLNHTAVTKK
jgi:biopolymer transport protein ExbD